MRDHIVNSPAGDETLNRRHVLLATTALAASTLAGGTLVAQAQAQRPPAASSSGQRPNILVIFGDDIGVPQISAYTMGMMGYRTPNIDRIAKEGAIFTDAYGQQSCTAGRASFILGQEPFRTGLLTIGMPGDPHGIADWMPTIADVMKTQGYATGQFGKNHLGDRDEHLPTQAWLRRVLRQSLPPQCRGGARGLLLSEGSGVQEEVRPARRAQDHRPTARSRTPARSTPSAWRRSTRSSWPAAKDFIDRQHKANKPFFVWFNSTRMHVFTHLKQESLGQDRQGHPCRRHGRA